MARQSSNLPLTEPLKCTIFFGLITVRRIGRSQAQIRHQISFHGESCDPGEFGQIQVIAAAPMNRH
jgi:hypothetical protein